MANWGKGGVAYCFGVTWYLQVDFQLFVGCTLLMMIYFKKRRLFIGIMGVLIVCSSVYNFYTTYIIKWHNYAEVSTADHSFAVNYYIHRNPCSRFASYAVGVIVGVLYMEYISMH